MLSRIVICFLTIPCARGINRGPGPLFIIGVRLFLLRSIFSMQEAMQKMLGMFRLQLLLLLWPWSILEFVIPTKTLPTICGKIQHLPMMIKKDVLR